MGHKVAAEGARVEGSKTPSTGNFGLRQTWRDAAFGPQKKRCRATLAAAVQNGKFAAYTFGCRNSLLTPAATERSFFS